MNPRLMKIVSINLSKHKGTRKEAVDKATLIKDDGIKSDAHAGPWHRQVSFLSSENIISEQKKGLDVSFGDFAENFTTQGVDWKTVPVGTRLKIGTTAVIEITQIGKECHKKCAIYYQAGDCIMPKEGVFGRVIEGGTIHVNDDISFLENA